MRVLFDAFWWVEGPFSNQQVMRSFINTWRADFPEDELTIAVPAKDRNDLPAHLSSQFDIATTHLRPHALAAALEMPRLARKIKADIIVNHNFAPVSGRSVIFLHDVMFQTDPEWFTRSERMYFGLMPLLAPRASLVTTSTTSELERVRANNPRIKAVERVGIGLDPDLRALPAHMPSAAAGLTGFVLSVGRLNIRKNLAFTLRAAVASGALTPERPLVVVGEREGKADDLQPVVAEAIADGLVRFIGQVSVSELRWLYENADLFLFLSLGEGFGLPPLEALSCGCPVLVSDLPVFRETMADRARFTSPTNLAVAAHAIAHALAIEGRAADAKLLPLDPERFEWSACVARLRSAIEHHVLRAS